MCRVLGFVIIPLAASDVTEIIKSYLLKNLKSIYYRNSAGSLIQEIRRGKCKQEVVDAAEKLKKPALLEAAFNVLANNAFHKISDEVRQEFGLPLSEKVFPLWKNWLYERAKDF